MSEDELFRKIGAPKTGEVSRLDGKPLGPEVPAYLVYPTSFPRSTLVLANHVKIVDFGESFLGDNKPATLNTPLVFRAPEVIFDDDWDWRVDLWTLGCTVLPSFRWSGTVTDFFSRYSNLL
jgi:serine/threonine-protein kinase SRPK3